MYIDIFAPLKPFCLILALFLQLSTIAFAQVSDSSINISAVDTLHAAKDTVPLTNNFDNSKCLSGNRFFNVLGKGEFEAEKISVTERKDWLFYSIMAVIFLLALLRLSYLKYFNDLFRLFFKTTLRQSQLREQLLQSQLTGLMFNLFFFISAGMYLFLLVRYYDIMVTVNKWRQLGICIGLISTLYLVKYAVLQATGWIFGMRAAIETYTFIVFLINKVMGVLLVPFIILLAFASSGIVKVALTLSLLMISGMFVYRFIRSYVPIQNDIKVSRFHFFLYLCAFEVTPLLLIYKVLIKFF